MAEQVRPLEIRPPFLSPGANPPRPAPWRKPRIIEIDDARKLIFQYFKLVGQARRNRAEQAEYEQCQQAVSRLQPEIIAEVVFPLRETGRVEIYDLLPNNLRKAVVAAVNEIEFGPGYVAPAAPAPQPAPPIKPPPAPPVVPPQVITPEWEIRKLDEVEAIFAQVVRYLKQNPGKEITIGRNNRADVIIREDKALSGRHVIVCYDGTNFWVKDLDSANGTFYQKQKIKPFEKVIIREGEEITFGSGLKLRFFAGEQSLRHAEPIVLVTPDPVPKWAAKDPSEIAEVICQVIGYLKRNPGREVIIGRNDQADVILRGDHTLSSRHMVLGYDGQVFWVEDLNSLNGTSYKGQKIAQNQKVVVNEGEELILGGVKIRLAERDFMVKPAISPVAKPQQVPIVSPEAITLRDRVRNVAQLLFSRNIDLAEFIDIVSVGAIRTNGGGVKYFRYGIGTEYGDEKFVISIVMKKGFWGAEGRRSRFRNIFLTEVQGEKYNERTLRNVTTNDFIDQAASHDELLTKLARQVEYNRLLQLRDEDDPINKLAPQIGMTVLGLDVERFMGNFPQLEIAHEIDLDQVEKILVPQHLWAEVSARAKANPRVLALLQKVEGTGATKAEFLQGREKLGRRSRFNWGQFVPNFGYEAFHLFEQAYFRLVAKGNEQQLSYLDRAKAMIEQHGFQAHQLDWLRAYSVAEAPDSREENDWKIFINPREETFFRVLEEVAKVLGKHNNLVSQYKIPLDLGLDWRPGRPWKASNTPKIVIYVNQQSLPTIIRAIEQGLASLHDCGFGQQPGPAFARRYGNTDLIFYKMEAFEHRRDQRVDIANEAEYKAQAAGISDPNEILRLKQAALSAAGYVGENFYRRISDVDPLEGLTK